MIADHPERPFQAHEITATGPTSASTAAVAAAGATTPQRELERWRRRIAAWRSEVEVFLYFNNDWEAFAPPRRPLAGRAAGI